MHFPALIVFVSVLSVDAAAPRTFLWQEVGNPSCVRCCESSDEPAEPPKKTRMKEYVMYPMPRVQPRIEMSILKALLYQDPLLIRPTIITTEGGLEDYVLGYVLEREEISVEAKLQPRTGSEKGEFGDKGPPGTSGKEGIKGPQGHLGIKGQKGQVGPPGNSCKVQYSAFSVARRKSLHSTEYFQTVVFDTEFVNLYQHFNMFSGTFVCYVPGVYFFNLNVHTWNLKETYLHIMKNEQEVAILYAQPSDRSIMQSQSLMLHMKEKDEVWVRMFKRERENALYNDETDVYIIFNGYLIRPADE